MSELPLFCERCGAQLEHGKGEFYVVRIEAFADPTPPSITAEDLQRDIPAEIERLLESMRDLFYTTVGLATRRPFPGARRRLLGQTFENSVRQVLVELDTYTGP